MLGFTLRMAWQAFADRANKDLRMPIRVRDFVEANARRGDPEGVLATMDRFATEVRFLMNIGPAKGPLIRELFAKLPANARILELGAFCGYSSILFAHNAGPDARIVSVEKSRSAVEGARANIEFAGLSSRIEIIHGPSTETIPTLEGPFDLVFLDHMKDLYLPDLQALEANGLLHPGTIVVADNVGPLFDAKPYLDYVRHCGRYDSEHKKATLEYSSVPDAVEVSIFRQA
jgi:catechol O-methyltransferase